MTNKDSSLLVGP